MQDYKRAMQQEPLRSPMVERGKEDYGFSSGDEEEGVEKKG